MNIQLNRRSLLTLMACGMGCTHPTRKTSSSPSFTIHRDSLQWMEKTARQSIKGCQKQADNGITIYTPDGVGNYGALWTRDFYYMLQIFDGFDQDKVKEAIQYLINGIREDGVAPDRRRVDGIPVYEAGGMGKPVALPPLDNAAFLVSLVYLYSSNTADLQFAKTVLNSLDKVMRAIPRSEYGLVWNESGAPHSPYGFTDTVGKTGELLFCSLLDWKASRELIWISQQCRDTQKATYYLQRSKRVESNIGRLADPKTGLFFAASHDCKQIDVWGNAFAVAIGFPLHGKANEPIVRFFADRYDHVIEKGQVRHLVQGEYWERMLLPIEPGTYQNGGYWGTPSGWVLSALAKAYPHLAAKTWNDLVQDYQTRGIHEWINGSEVRLPKYVASITNPLAEMRKLIKHGIVQVI